MLHVHLLSLLFLNLSIQPIHLCSLDWPSKTSTSNNRNTKINLYHNTKIKEKISHNIPNRGWAHIHPHTVDIIEYAVVFVVGDLVTLPTSDRPHCEVIHHIRVCRSSGTRPMIAKRHSITLWCSDHTHTQKKNQFTCVHLCTCVDYRSHCAASPCPWGTRFADDYKWTRST